MRYEKNIEVICIVTKPTRAALIGQCLDRIQSAHYDDTPRMFRIPSDSLVSELKGQYPADVVKAALEYYHKEMGEFFVHGF